jgi:hypothetical protein
MQYAACSLGCDAFSYHFNDILGGLPAVNADNAPTKPLRTSECALKYVDLLLPAPSILRTPIQTDFTDEIAFIYVGLKQLDFLVPFTDELRMQSDGCFDILGGLSPSTIMKPCLGRCRDSKRYNLISCALRNHRRRIGIEVYVTVKIEPFYRLLAHHLRTTQF